MSDTPASPTEHPPAALPRGTRLGEFELRHVLGVGGFAIVYLAFDHQLEREVAVKEYMPTMLAGRTETLHVSLRSQGDAETFALGLKSFVNEARLLARFDLPSLVRVHRFWEGNGTAYMAMPVVRGQSAKAWRLASSTPPDEAWLRALLEPMLDTLAKLHAEAVYHRDIAPDNIQIDEDGRPVLLDLGAARRVIGDATQTLTAILKPAYAPIEQYAEVGALRQGAWTDLYALGATLHFLLLGRPPLPATARALHDELPPLAGQTLPGVSLRFLQVVDWMLSPRPQDRPQSVDMLRDALQGLVSPPDRVVPAQAAPVQWERTQHVSGRPASADLTPVTGAPAAVPASPPALAPPPAEPSANAADDGATVLRSAPAGAAMPTPPVTRHTEPALEPASAPAPAPRPSSAAAEPLTTPAAGPGRSRLPALAGVAASLVVLAAAGAWWSTDRTADAGLANPAALAPSAAPASGPVAAAGLLAQAGRPDTGPAADMAAGLPAAPSSMPPPAPSAGPQPSTAAAQEAPAKPADTLVSPPPAPVRAANGQPSTATRSGADNPPPRRTAAAPKNAPQAAVPPVATPPEGVSAALVQPPPEQTAPAPAVLAPPVVTPAPAAVVLQSPTERCGRRVLIALWNCIDRQCREPELRDHPECVKLREDRERNVRGRY